MLYKEDWGKTKVKFLEFWERENHDRPLISVTAPRDAAAKKTVKAPDNLLDRWMDIEYVIKSHRATFESTFYGGEAYPQLWPNLGPDIFGAFLGCDLEFGKDTSWAKHFVKNWSETGSFRFNPENKWWKKIVQMTEAAVADAKGDYLVGITDLHPSLDGLVSLRGPEELCMDLYDDPESVKKVVFELLDVFKTVTDQLYQIILQNQQGSTNWMGIWHPAKWYVTSCDFICMISGDMFDKFVLPELTKEIEWLDASVFHLDGPGALKHLDKLLAIPKLKGIQWVYGAGQPSASHWIPVLKKIQDAGKLIHVSINPEELDILLENLKPEGVMYSTWCRNESEARNLLKKAEKAYI